jgi:GTPase SAR1 family protein
MNELADNNVTEAPRLFVGNKSDLRGSSNSDSLLSTAQGEEVAKKHAALFVETSAKTSEHVYQAFHELVTRLTEGDSSASRTVHDGGVKLETGGGEAGSSYCC